MGNILPPNRDIHELYDLKGSTLGRQVSAEEIQNNPRIVRKDLNWLSDNKKLKLGPQKKKAFMEQLERDNKVLSLVIVVFGGPQYHGLQSLSWSSLFLKRKL